MGIQKYLRSSWKVLGVSKYFCLGWKNQKCQEINEYCGKSIEMFQTFLFFKLLQVCHSKSGEVNSAKVANLVKAYVDKYKHSRKKNPEEAVSCERK